ncbi:unnamed protein product [Prorocentrum cordatum]|uniref:Guanylate cyclase domain-containing protein n=1 Tax=Prorocentrum cordatum TaxID=2364126 RepID=A0ABN9UZK3_9DINO|nr:unnamed protein product [Polarella glacialis]
MARPRRGRCAYQQRLRSRSSGGEDEDDEEGSDVEGGTSSDDQEVEWSQSGTASSGTASSATGGSATGGSELGGSELGGSGADESDESDGSVGPWRRVAAKCRVASTQACEDKLEKRFPEQWHEDVVVPNIKLGARVAMFTGLAYLLFFGQTMGIIHEMVCGGNHRSMFSDANSFVFYFSSFFGTAYCIRRPTLLAYKAVVFVIFVSWLVSDLFVGVDYRSFTSVLYCADVTGELTCHSCVFPSYNMMLDAMIWVLLQPSVCAKKSWMNCLFGIWMVCFCSAGVLYHRDDSVMDKYAGLFDLFVGASFLSFLEWFAVRRKRRAMRSEQLKFKLDLDHMLTTRSMYDVLKHMVPSFVIVPLLNSPACRVDVPNIERASVMFICLVGFDVQARSLTASELLGLLNRSFIEFDRVCQTHRVTKIETWMEDRGTSARSASSPPRLRRAPGGATAPSWPACSGPPPRCWSSSPRPKPTSPSRWASTRGRSWPGWWAESCPVSGCSVTP